MCLAAFEIALDVLQDRAMVGVIHQSLAADSCTVFAAICALQLGLTCFPSTVNIA